MSNPVVGEIRNYMDQYVDGEQSVAMEVLSVENGAVTYVPEGLKEKTEAFLTTSLELFMKWYPTIKSGAAR
jgi:hypothetical protein